MSGRKKLSVPFLGSKSKKDKKDSAQKDSSSMLGGSADQVLRRPATYCAPHTKVPGEITLTASFLVLFEPDHTNQHVREVGVTEHRVCIEIRDILECGAVAMPMEVRSEEIMAYFLQLHVRTLDGVRWCAAEDTRNTWCVVFRLESREMLHEVAHSVLELMEDARRKDDLAMQVAMRVPFQEQAGSCSPKKSRTSVPFPCLDCVAEVEAAAQRQRQSLKAVEALTAALQQMKPEDSDSDSDAKVILQPGNVTSTLLTPQIAGALRQFLPVAIRIEGAVEWVLRYTPKAHGTSLNTLYRSVGDFKQTLLLVQDAQDCIFGGYAPEAWGPHPRFYGSGEAFVFALDHSTKAWKAPKPKVHLWSGENSYFMHSDDSGIAMGGGDGSHALFLSADLQRGFSGPTRTFGNPPLASAQEFVVKDIEIWAFEEV